MNIATILTSYNRREKTLRCLRSLKKSLIFYNKNCKGNANIHMEIFLTNDGCTDGTVEAIEDEFENKIHIYNGDGNLYWAGGMRASWKEAIKSTIIWDFFFLINDDVELMETCIMELLTTNEFSKKKFDKYGIYSGITYSFEKPRHLTYSGMIYINKLKGTMQPINQKSYPQECDVTNANILLIHKDVYDKIGIFYKGFIHSAADYDYSNLAKKNGFPVLITAKCCGYCDNDHPSKDDIKNKMLSMTLSERKKYYSNPIHGVHDYVLLIKRMFPFRWIFAVFGKNMRLYFPKIYYWLDTMRNKKMNKNM